MAQIKSFLLLGQSSLPSPFSPFGQSRTFLNNPAVLLPLASTSSVVEEWNLQVFLLLLPVASHTQSSLRKESPAELMLLTFVWHETASGTARSKTENGLHS